MKLARIISAILLVTVPLCACAPTDSAGDSSQVNSDSIGTEQSSAVSDAALTEVVLSESASSDNPSSSDGSSISASSSASSSDTSSVALQYPVYEGTRDPWLWPFSRESIWNMPIGSNAVYEPTNFEASKNVAFDPEHFAVATYDDPLIEVRRYTSFKDRWPGSTNVQGKIYWPESFVIPEKYIDGNFKNSCTAILQPDGYVAHIAPACRPAGESYATGYLYKRNKYTLYDDGIGGSHGGSGLSVLGGSIRKGELKGDKPIRHAIKINIYANKYCYYGADRKGFVWPADTADGYANKKDDPRHYAGSDKNVVMGSLLALPPDVTAESLGLKTEVAKKLFYALQNYGAYVSDDSAWDSYCFCIEDGVSEEVKAKYGYTMKDNGGAYYNDCMKMFEALCVITNNSPTSIGGGGTPRQPLAPDFAK